MSEDRVLPDRPKPYEVERDRFGVYYSGPLEVGECIEVVAASWDGLMMILDRHYPADVFTGESGDPGPRIVALTREVERLREALLTARAALREVARTRRSDAWGNAVAEANKALTEISAALDEEEPNAGR